MRPHQFTGDMQSQAKSPRVCIRAFRNPVKALEDALDVPGSDARSVVLDGNSNEVGFGVAVVRCHVHRASGPAVLNRVID